MSQFKSGFVSVIGLPNAGKSSLVNTIIGEDVSIVTSKPQTTRKRTLGMWTKENEFQVVFVDTPGFTESTQGLNSYLKKEFQESLKGMQVLVVTIAPWEFEDLRKPWGLEITQNINVPKIYIATQGDKLKVDMEKWKSWSNEPLLITSSKTKVGLEELQTKILEHMTVGEAFYDLDIYTNQTMREMAAELVRKQCFESLHQEIPYGLAVNLRDFKEEKILKIQADIVLSRENHKSMVIGKGAEMLKKIGTGARLEMEKAFDQKVFLKLHVVVKPQWMKNKDLLEEFGYAE